MQQSLIPAINTSKELDISSIHISSLGYKPETISLLTKSDVANLIIELEEKPFIINEILVTPKNNPAIRIIKKALNNKKRNNHDLYSDFSYCGYYKMRFDIKNVPNSNKNDSEPIDSIIPQKIPPSVISENAISVIRKKGKDEERITATKTVGMDNPLFAQLVYTMFHKSLSFYNNSISIFPGSNHNRMLTDYLSPLSDNCLNAYNYELDNTFINLSDTIFEIVYSPKKNKNFNALTGKIFISSKNYAISNIVAEPTGNKYIDFRFKQDYQFINGRWFPQKLEEEIVFSYAALKNKSQKEYYSFYILSTITDVVFNDIPSLTPNSPETIENRNIYLQENILSVNNDSVNNYDSIVNELIIIEEDNIHRQIGVLKKAQEVYDTKKGENIRLEKVYLDEKLIAKSDSVLNQVRAYPLTEHEKYSYNVGDTIKEEYPFIDNMMNSITKIDEGKISVSMIDVDFTKLYTYNRHEGSRLGLGLYTNEKLIKYLSLGGYVGYGFKDKKIKYDGEIELNFNKTYDISFIYSYHNTLKEAGTDMRNYKTLSQGHFLRDFMAYRFDHCIEHKLEGHFQLLRGLKFGTTVSFKNLNPQYLYTYKGDVIRAYNSDNVELSLKNSHNEEIMTMGLSNKRIVSSSGNPVISVSYKRGINLFRNESLIYNKINATIDFNAYNSRIGESKLRIEGGYIDRNLPYGLLFTGEGSKDRIFSFVINNSFQTMQPYEFLSDKYINLFYSHNFGKLLLKTKYFKPEFKITQNVGWGNLNNPELYGDIDFKTKDKIYLESGLIISNIVNLNYLNAFSFGVGIGAFYRYGYYSKDTFIDNAAFKVSLGISF